MMLKSASLEGSVFLLSWAAFTIAILLTAPIQIILHVDANPKVTFKIVISIYAINIHLDGHIKKYSNFTLQRNDQQKIMLTFRQAVSFSNKLLERAISKRIDITGQIGTGDAYSTVMIVGGLRFLLCALFRSFHSQIVVNPAFNQPILKMHGRCILCFRGGDIILAGIKALGIQPLSRKA